MNCVSLNPLPSGKKVCWFIPRAYQKGLYGFMSSVAAEHRIKETMPDLPSFATLRVSLDPSFWMQDTSVDSYSVCKVVLCPDPSAGASSLWRFNCHEFLG